MRIPPTPTKRKPAGPGEVEAGFQTTLTEKDSVADFAKPTLPVKFIVDGLTPEYSWIKDLLLATVGLVLGLGFAVSFMAAFLGGGHV